MHDGHVVAGAFGTQERVEQRARPSPLGLDLAFAGPVVVGDLGVVGF